MSVFLQSNFVSKWQKSVDTSLNAYIKNIPEGCPTPLREAMQYSLLLPGKRIRPLLVFLAAEACGNDPQKAMPAACAIEMVHAFSLIHDDLPAMDDDDMRRGKPSNHKVFGEAQAILAGDALLSLAFEVLANDLPSDVALQCCTILAKATGPTGMIGGQSADIQHATHSTLEDLEFLHRRKTGALLEVSLHMGAQISGASVSEIESLLEYGFRIGLAFQIIDDVLDEGEDAKSYVNIIGLDESRKKADLLIQEAQESLAEFGDRAESLCDLAQFIVERDR